MKKGLKLLSELFRQWLEVRVFLSIDALMKKGLKLSVNVNSFTSSFPRSLSIDALMKKGLKLNEWRVALRDNAAVPVFQLSIDALMKKGLKQRRQRGHDVLLNGLGISQLMP